MGGAVLARILGLTLSAMGSLWLTNVSLGAGATLAGAGLSLVLLLGKGLTVFGLALAVVLAPFVGLWLAVCRLIVECEWLHSVGKRMRAQRLCRCPRRWLQQARNALACCVCWRLRNAWACYRRSRTSERCRRKREFRLRFAARRGAIIPWLESVLDKLRLLSMGYWGGHSRSACLASVGDGPARAAIPTTARRRNQ